MATTEDDKNEVTLADKDLYLKVFAKIDHNSTGCISQEEFKKYMISSFGFEDKDFIEFMENFLQGMDKNNDGKINVAEFTKFCVFMEDMAS